jgi:hypothetical protein
MQDFNHKPLAELATALNFTILDSILEILLYAWKISVYAGKFSKTSIFSRKISITWKFTILGDHPGKITAYT